MSDNDTTRPALRRIRNIEMTPPSPAHEDSQYLGIVRRMSSPDASDAQSKENDEAFLVGIDGVPVIEPHTRPAPSSPAASPKQAMEMPTSPSSEVGRPEQGASTRDDAPLPEPAPNAKAMTPRELGDEVCRRTSILELVSRYTTMKSSGKEVKGCCPLPHHQTDKTPSFFVNEEKNVFNCHGCRSGGNPIRFLSEVEGISYKDAFRILAKEAGMELGSPKPADHRLEILDKTRDLYHGKLLRHRKAQEYLSSRGISMETIEKFKMGFCYGDEFDSAVRDKKRKLIDAALETSIVYEKEGKVRNLMRGRVVFPITDKHGQTIAFAGRVLPGVADAPKYLNTHESPFFKKSETLFGLNLASRAISKEGFAVVVEGYMDVAMLHQVGVENSCAVMGGGANARAIKSLWSHTKRIVFCLDGDAAGEIGAYRSILAAADTIEDGQTIAVASLPAGMDPDEYAIKYGAAAFIDLCRDATPLAALMAERCGAEYDLSAPEGRVAYFKEIEESANFFKNSPGTISEIIREAEAKISVAVAVAALNEGNLVPEEIDHAIDVLTSMRKTLSLSKTASETSTAAPHRIV